MDKGWVQEQELGSFSQSVTEFQKGEMRPLEFKQCRMQQGVYGQRQEGLFMVRVKVPLGKLNAGQLDKIADVVEQFSNGKAHITTRQAIEIHDLALEGLAPMMKELGTAGLTSRESCGNTVRNVTGCWRNEICPDGSFDVTPYAQALTKYLLRHPLTQDLPRKFKIAFSGCGQDCALTAIHDLGFIARWNEGNNGNARPFFRVMVGGGLGAAPKLAQALEEQVSTEEIISLTEAVLTVFSELGERKDRGRARIKFLVARLGIEKFRELVREKWQKSERNQPKIRWKKSPRFKFLLPVSEPKSESYIYWKRTNVFAQNQNGFFSIAVLLPAGDVTAVQIRALAFLSRKLKIPEGIRTTIDQGFLMTGIHQKELPLAYQELVKYGLAAPGKGAIHQIVCCQGAETCQVALTRSKTMAKMLSHVLFQMYGEAPEDLLGVSIRVSGCPNSCSQHYLGTLGFQGAVSQQQGRALPCYMLYVGGKTGEEAKLAEFVMKLPAKRIPKAVMDLVDWYRADRYQNAGETFAQFLERMGKELIRQKLEPLTRVPPFDQERDLYYDWGAEEPYQLENRGSGECAGVAE